RRPPKGSAVWVGLNQAHPIPLYGSVAPMLDDALGELCAHQFGSSLTPLSGLLTNHDAFGRTVAVTTGASLQQSQQLFQGRFPSIDGGYRGKPHGVSQRVTTSAAVELFGRTVVDIKHHKPVRKVGVV